MNYRHELANILQEKVNIDKDYVMQSLEVPERHLGDFALPCFKLAKEQKKAPAAIAQEMATQLQNTIPFVESVQQAGPYINFYLKKDDFAKNVLSEVIEKGTDYGSSTIGNGKTIVVDYSSPNIAKPFHVGHLRSTVMGQALYNIYSFLGYTCVGVNHLGDWGTQFGKLIVAYNLWSSKEAVEEGGIAELNRIYVKFHQEAKEDPTLDDKGRACLLKMEEGDRETLDIWQFFYDISMKEFKRIYKRLGVDFDYYTGESFYNDKMAPVVKELKEKGLLQESDGAQIVDLEHEGLPPCMILRSDGATLYSTRDLATVFYRKETFDFHKVLYLTAIDQALHFNQFFKVIKLMGYDWWEGLLHVPFGLVTLEEGKLSTREGNVVLMEDLLDAVVNRAKEIIQEKNPNLANKEDVANAVGIGSVIFNDLYNTRIKSVVFSLEKMLNFDGETGPFVQYSHARANSLLKKGGAIDFATVDYACLTDEAAQNLLAQIYQYKDRLLEVTEKNEPYILTRYLTNLAQTFNKFYQSNPIISQDTDIKNARLALVYATKNILHNGLKLLGINAPDQM
ncbi:MAG: arginine--tRNA ligase [Defluviitaleaceae bacterium]|nr:arginine--tRNA ligase [Defluviitaleaceae bacterium]